MTDTLTVEEIEELERDIKERNRRADTVFAGLTVDQALALISLAKAGLEMGWRPIEEAPNDSNVLLVFAKPVEWGWTYDNLWSQFAPQFAEKGYTHFRTVAPPSPPERGQ